MKNIVVITCLSLCLSSCISKTDHGPDPDVLNALGGSVKESFLRSAEDFRSRLAEDPGDYTALYGFTETKILLYLFGYMAREDVIPDAYEAFHQLWQIDSVTSQSQKLKGIFSFLDWNWQDTEAAFLKAIKADPGNLSARHWYALYLSAMARFDEAMAQSDSIVPLDPDNHYGISRGSMLYFARRNVEMRDLMIRAVERDTAVPWGYDWLGMAYCELEDFENSVKTYQRAFELSDGTVEVGAGLGHALGLAGEYKAAKRMADFYEKAAENQYLPPVQRAFIHIGIGEYDKALNLLEQAYDEKSWFLIFMNVEPWYDPIREDKRFQDIVKRMAYPE